MTKIINENQTCGSKGKDIQNNILNIKTIIDYIKGNGKIGAMVLINQEENFDRIEHNYIGKVLENFWVWRKFPKMD